VVVSDTVRDFVTVPQVVEHWTVAVTVPTGSMATIAQSVFESKLHEADGPVAAGSSEHPSCLSPCLMCDCGYCGKPMTAGVRGFAAGTRQIAAANRVCQGLRRFSISTELQG
jgi:hypothetical protein